MNGPPSSTIQGAPSARPAVSAAGALRTRGALLALLTLAALAMVTTAAAQAAPAWLSPVDVSAADQNAGGPDVAFDAQGDLTAIWTRSEGDTSIVQAKTRPAGGDWSQSPGLSVPSRYVFDREVAVDALGNAVAIWVRVDGGRAVLQAATRPAGGGPAKDGWSDPQDLAERTSEPRLAVDARGNAVVVWRDFSPETGRSTVHAATRPAEGGPDKDGWSDPQGLSDPDGNAGAAAVAAGADGSAVAVWIADGIEQATRPPGASPSSARGGWSAPQQVSEAGNAPQVAVDAKGNAVAVWYRYRDRNQVVQAATRSTTARDSGGPWSTAHDLSSSDQTQSSTGPQLAVDAQGNATVVWARAYQIPQYEDPYFNPVTSRNIQAATRPAGGGPAKDGWSEPEDLSPVQQNADSPQLAVGPHGHAAVLWTRFEGQTAVGTNTNRYALVAATRAAGAPLMTCRRPAYTSAAGKSRPTRRATRRRRGQLSTALAAASSWRAMTAPGPSCENLQVPEAGMAGSPVSFSVVPVDVWSSVASTRWDFGDGKGADGKSVSHSYAAPGSYQATVTSTDGLGNATSEKHTVTITSAPSGGGTAPGTTTGRAPDTTTTPATGALQPGGLAPGAGSPNAEQLSALRRCLAMASRRSTDQRRRRARRRCTLPGRPARIRARAASSSEIVLSFLAAGSVGRSGPPARRYLIKQSTRPIGSERAFRRARTLCRRSCAFRPQRIGQPLSLRITDLRSKTTYYYAVKAVGAAQRAGPRSRTATARTR